MSALARAKSRGEPVHLRQAAFSTWHRRWNTIISVAAQRALAASLISFPEVIGAGNNIPSLDDVLAEGRYDVEEVSRVSASVGDVSTVLDEESRLEVASIPAETCPLDGGSASSVSEVCDGRVPSILQTVDKVEKPRDICETHKNANPGKTVKK